MIVLIIRTIIKIRKWWLMMIVGPAIIFDWYCHYYWFYYSSLHTEDGRSSSSRCQRGRSIQTLQQLFPSTSNWDYSQLIENVKNNNQNKNTSHKGATWTQYNDNSNGRFGGNRFEGYYHPLPVSRRLPKFRQLLHSFDENDDNEGVSPKNIAVVGHSAVLKALVGVKMKNCEMVVKALKKWK